jgi:hypothetical protein
MTLWSLGLFILIYSLFSVSGPVNYLYIYTYNIIIIIIKFIILELREFLLLIYTSKNNK